MTHVSKGTITFIGAGSMSEAIIRGLLAGGLCTSEQIKVHNRANVGRLFELAERYGIHPALSDDQKQQHIREADILFLCMKPKDAAEALRTLATLIRPEQLIVSVIAGLSIQTIARLLNVSRVQIVRSMPNTSATIGLGATGVSFGEHVTAEHRKLALAMFAATGIAIEVEESLLAAVTAVSGSGPAYIYAMMEAMIAAAVAQGLAPEDAHKLTVQTVLGAASMVQATGEQPAELRRKVTSPSGTTEAALHVMSERDFAGIMAAAMKRCAERADELGATIERSALES